MVRNQPLRVIVDALGRTPPTAQVFNKPGKVLLAIGESVKTETKEALTLAGAELLELPSKEGMVDLTRLLRTLSERQITSILVEGGGTLLGSLFDSRLVDKVITFIAPVIIGGAEAKTAVAGKGVDKVIEAMRLERVNVEKFGDDVMINGYVKH
jgi:diaminohydroxyphosphoribosylaminopyrimidine deaminase/5-amino-6-(5-phosphoribosylamino)uracil reductase